MLKLDYYECMILKILQQDATLSTAEIAERIGLSQAPCWRRIDRLRKEGVIKAQVVLVDRLKIGLNAQIFAQVKLNSHGRQHLDEFAAAIQKFDEVLECFVMLGSVDFLIRIVTYDIESYERFFFDHLSRVSGIQEINSFVALSEIKSTTALMTLVAQGRPDRAVPA